MSITILEDAAGVYLSQYYGGEERGVCHQIALQHSGEYIQLTRKQMEFIVAAYLAFRFDLPLNKLVGGEHLEGSKKA